MEDALRNLMDSESLYLLEITRDEVVAQSINRCKQLCDELLSSKAPVGGRVIILFQGYDDDSREVFEIPEIRSWVNRLFTKIPEILYFVSHNDMAPTDNTLMMCWLDIEYARSANAQGKIGEQFPVCLDYNSKGKEFNRVVAYSVALAQQRGDMTTARAILQRLGMPPEEFL